MQSESVRAMAPICMSICCMGRPMRFSSAATRPYSSAARRSNGQQTTRPSARMSSLPYSSQPFGTLAEVGFTKLLLTLTETIQSLLVRRRKLKRLQ